MYVVSDKKLKNYRTDLQIKTSVTMVTFFTVIYAKFHINGTVRYPFNISPGDSEHWAE